MDQQDDRTQQMIDEGLIFGPDENNPPRADDPSNWKMRGGDKPSIFQNAEPLA